MMMDETKTRYYGWSVVFASWLAVFCLFGYRATFAILKGPMAHHPRDGPRAKSPWVTRS